MGFNCLKATGQLRGSDLLFTTNFPEIPGIWPKAGHGAWAVPNTSQIKKNLKFLIIQLNVNLAKYS